VLQDKARQFVVHRELLEHVLGSRRLAFGGLADDRQALFFEENLLDLLRRRQVEDLARNIVRFLLRLAHGTLEISTLLAQHVDVELLLKGVEQTGVAREVGHDAQFDLRVVRSIFDKTGTSGNSTSS